MAASDLGLVLTDDTRRLPVVVGGDGRFDLPVMPEERWFPRGGVSTRALANDARVRLTYR